MAQAYGRELAEAYDWCQKYRASRREAELHQAWDLYYHVFKRINKQLPQLTVLDLHYVSPALASAEVILPDPSPPPPPPPNPTATLPSWPPPLSLYRHPVDANGIRFKSLAPQEVLKQASCLGFSSLPTPH